MNINYNKILDILEEYSNLLEYSNSYPDYQKTKKEIEEQISIYQNEINKITAIQKNLTIDDLIKNLYIEKPFYGYILSGFNKVFTFIVPIAAVTLNKELYINPIFFSMIREIDRNIILEHECLHLSFLHFSRFEKELKDPLLFDLANVAMDCAINQLLDLGILSKSLITFEKVKEMTGNNKLKKKETAEYYFNELVKNKKRAEETIKKSYKDLVNDIGKNHKYSMYKSINQSTGNIDNIANDSMRHLLQKAKEYQLEVSSRPGNRMCNNMEIIMPLLPSYMNIDKTIWKRVINKTIENNPIADCNMVYNMPNRRNKNSFWGKKHILENNKVIVGIDSSASITFKQLSMFLGHISLALRSCDLVADLIICDTKIKEIRKNVKKIDNNFKLKGRGGTDLTKILDYIKSEYPRKKMKLLLLTDGCTVWRNEPNIEVSVIYTKKHQELAGIKYSSIIDV